MIWFAASFTVLVIGLVRAAYAAPGELKANAAAVMPPPRDACMDEANMVGLLETMELPVSPYVTDSARNQLTCEQLAKVWLFPTSGDAQSSIQAIKDIGVVTSNYGCNTSLKAWCKEQGTQSPGLSCEKFRNETIGSMVCCKTCRNECSVGPWRAGLFAAIDNLFAKLGYFDIFPDAPDKTCNRCSWPGVFCDSATTPNSGVTIYLPGHGLNGVLSPEALVELCPYLKGLNVSNNNITAQLPELVGCKRITQLDVSGNPELNGPIPAGLANLCTLRDFRTHLTGLSGVLAEDMFQCWTRVNHIEISGCDFEGSVPDTSSCVELTVLSVAHNKFVELGPLPQRDCSSQRQRINRLPLMLNLAFNNFKEFPSVLRHGGTAVTDLILQGNPLRSLPPWGYFVPFLPGLPRHYEENALRNNMLISCPWAGTGTLKNEAGLQVSSADLAPAWWSSLENVDMSNCPLEEVSARHFMNFFASAPNLRSLKCMNCRLWGSVPRTFDLRWYFTQLGESATGGCEVFAAFRSLQTLDLRRNKNIACTVVQVRSNIEETANQLTWVECAECPAFMVTPPGAEETLPLRDQAECKCKGEMQYAQGPLLDEACFCEDGTFLDHKSFECRPCHPRAQRCIWHNRTDSRALPPVQPGFYLAASGIIECGSEETCTQESAEQFCAPGRNQTEEACATCKAGHHGGRNGPCSKCGRAFLYLLGLASGFVASVLLAPLLTWLFKLNRERVQNGAGDLEDMEHIAAAFKQLLKHIQMVALLFQQLSVVWPKELDYLRNAMDFLSAVRFNFGLSCVFQHTPEVLLGQVLVAPWVLLSIKGLAYWLQSRSWLPQALVSRIELGPGDYMQLIYFGWSLLLPSQAALAAEVFLLQKSPNGELRMDDFPNIEGGSPRWKFRMVPLASVAIVFNILPYLITTWYCVGRILRGNELQWHRIVRNGLHQQCEQFALVMVSKDLLLSVVGAFFARDSLSQCGFSAVLIALYTVLLWREEPFESILAQKTEVCASLMLIVMYIAVAFLGFAGNPDTREFQEFVGQGLKDPEYRRRVWCLFFIYLGASLLPFAIVLGATALTTWDACAKDALRALVRRLPARLSEWVRRRWQWLDTGATTAQTASNTMLALQGAMGPTADPAATRHVIQAFRQTLPAFRSGEAWSWFTTFWLRSCLGEVAPAEVPPVAPTKMPPVAPAEMPPESLEEGVAPSGVILTIVPGSSATTTSGSGRPLSEETACARWYSCFLKRAFAPASGLF